MLRANMLSLSGINIQTHAMKRFHVVKTRQLQEPLTALCDLGLSAVIAQKCIILRYTFTEEGCRCERMQQMNGN